MSIWSMSSSLKTSNDAKFIDENKNDDITNKSLFDFYNFGQKSCKVIKNSRRKPCKLHPNCKHNLGYNDSSYALYSTKKKTSLLKAYSANTFNSIRSKGFHAGLINLGATCYMNVQIQALYQNNDFRSILYNYQGNQHDFIEYLKHQQKEQDDNNEKINDIHYTTHKDYALLYLQYIFASLQSSYKKAINPHLFARLLGLPINVQQDIEEFWNLLLTYIENTIKIQPKLHDQLRSLFYGTYINVVQCKTCSYRSMRKSEYSSLQVNIRNINSLKKAIDEYFKIEYLKDDNQYMCDQCQVKRDAEKFIQLDTIPKYLNIQMMRFHYSFELNKKIKINTNINIPDQLDLYEYLSDEGKKQYFDNHNTTQDTDTSQDTDASQDTAASHSAAASQDITKDTTQNAINSTKDQTLFNKLKKIKLNSSAHKSISNQLPLIYSIDVSNKDQQETSKALLIEDINKHEISTTTNVNNQISKMKIEKTSMLTQRLSSNSIESNVEVNLSQTIDPYATLQIKKEIKTQKRRRRRRRRNKSQRTKKSNSSSRRRR